MSHENVEIVRRFLASVNERNLDGALGDVAPEAVLDWSRSEAPDSGVYRGPAQWGKWMTGRWEGLTDSRFDEAEAIDVPPDNVVLVAYLRARGRASGLEAEALAAAVWTLQAGKIVGLRLYQTREQALKAVGVEE